MVTEKIEKILNITMIGTCLFFIIFPYKYKYFYLWFVLGVFSTWIITLVYNKIELNKNYRFLIPLFIWLNLLGEIYFYYNFQYYDKILHTIIPLFICYCIFDYTKKVNFKNKIIVFLITLGVLSSFEIFEWLLDVLFNLNMMGVMSNGVLLMTPIDDTIIDLIMGSLASILVLYFRKYD